MLQRQALLAEAVEETVARRLDQKRLEIRRRRETPAGIAKADDDIRPHRLDDIERIELGPQPRR